MYVIDLNMDLGEGTGNDAAVMSFISSCSVACGGHYGDATTIKAALVLAKKYGVKAGAHPSFDDKENFGRVHVVCDETRFRESVTNQILSFTNAALAAAIPMQHIKMHGALYHATAHKPDFARWTVRLMQEKYAGIPLIIPPDCLLEQLAQKNNMLYLTEAFADRRYLESGRLVSRKEPNALITDVPKLVNQIGMMVKLKQLQTVTETRLDINAHTYCVHGDNAAIVDRFKEIIAALKLNKISIG